MCWSYSLVIHLGHGLLSLKTTINFSFHKLSSERSESLDQVSSSSLCLSTREFPHSYLVWIYLVQACNTYCPWTEHLLADPRAFSNRYSAFFHWAVKQESTTRHTQKIRPWWLSYMKINRESLQTRHVEQLDQGKVQPLVRGLWSKVFVP